MSYVPLLMKQPFGERSSSVARALSALALFSTACGWIAGLEDKDPRPRSASGGNSGAGGASGGDAGADGTSGHAGVDEGGRGGSATGGGGAGTSGGAGNANGGTSGDGGEDCEPLPQSIAADTSVGPGCVRIQRTYVENGATLTFAQGTIVRMGSNAFLAAAPFGGNDSSGIVAVGTEDEPILFTSDAEEPAPGDWQCVAIGGASSASEIRHATFEYGGAPCDATGADHEGMLQIGAALRAVSNNTFRLSSTHGVLLHGESGLRAFDDNVFSQNELASIHTAPTELLVFGDGLVFTDADDVILVDRGPNISGTGTVLAQPVPFHLPDGITIADAAVVTLAAGVRFEIGGSSIEVYDANLIVAGTEADPVVFTSAHSQPLAGDWGCVVFSAVTGDPRIDHAVFEYAGNGDGCSGAAYETALVVPGSATVTNSTFRAIAGSAITTRDDCPTAWCDNTFEDVASVPLDCFTPLACP
jgi:hypothetical protein